MSQPQKQRADRGKETRTKTRLQGPLNKGPEALPEGPDKLALQRALTDPAMASVAGLLALQNAAGNRAVQRFVAQRQAPEEEEELQLKTIRRQLAEKEQVLAMQPTARVGLEGVPVPEEVRSAIDRARGAGQPLESPVQEQIGVGEGSTKTKTLLSSDVQGTGGTRTQQIIMRKLKIVDENKIYDSESKLDNDRLKQGIEEVHRHRVDAMINVPQTYKFNTFQDLKAAVEKAMVVQSETNRECWLRSMLEALRRAGVEVQNASRHISEKIKAYKADLEWQTALRHHMIEKLGSTVYWAGGLSGMKESKLVSEINALASNFTIEGNGIHPVEQIQKETGYDPDGVKRDGGGQLSLSFILVDKSAPNRKGVSHRMLYLGMAGKSAKVYNQAAGVEEYPVEGVTSPITKNQDRVSWAKKYTISPH